MTTTAYYLIGCIFCIYNFTPKTKTAIWKYSVGIPLIFTFISFISSYPDMNSAMMRYPISSFGYEMGKWTSRIIIPFLISISVLYFFFFKKLANNGKAKLPILLIIATLGIGIFGEIQKEITAENNKNIEKNLDVENAKEEVKISVGLIKQKLPLTNADGLILYDILLAEKEKKVNYLYKSPNQKIEDLDKNDILEYKNTWKGELLQISKNNPKNSSFKKANYSMNFLLEDMNGKPILEIHISPENM